VNKSQLIDTLAVRFEGNRKQASHALESVIDTITREVAKGEKVAITGFGSFEKRVRDARWVRNPRTGERIKAKKTAIPKFNPGADLKAVVSGAKKLPKLTITAATGTAKAAGSTARAAGSTARKASPTKTTATKSAPAKKTTTTAKKSTPAKKTTSTTAAAKKSTAKKTTATKSTATKSTASKSSASKAPAKKTAAKSAPAKKSTTAKKAPAKSTTAKKTTAKKS